MTDKKFEEAVNLKNDILVVTKRLETIDNLFAEWNKMHQKSEYDFDFHYVDRKKEWELIGKMAEEFDEVRKEITYSVPRTLRSVETMLRNRLADYNKRFSKL